MTTIYLIRHSKPMNMDIKQIANSESLQIINEKNILSVEGEKRAEELSKIPGLKNIDYVISSNYARAMATARSTVAISANTATSTITLPFLAYWMACPMVMLFPAQS